MQQVYNFIFDTIIFARLTAAYVITTKKNIDCVAPLNKLHFFGPLILF